MNLFSLGCLSASLLAHQIFLMQILSYTQWYHFAFMIMSIALLGFGTSGTVLSLYQKRFLKKPEISFSILPGATAIAILVTHWLSQKVALDPYLLFWQWKRLPYIIVYYLLTFFPFLLGALAIGLTFLVGQRSIGKLYFVNLVGSGLGAMLGLWGVSELRPENLPLVSSGLVLLSLLPVKSPIPIKLTPLAVFILYFFRPTTLHVSEYKSLPKTLLLPDAKIVAEKPSVTGFLQAVQSSALRFAPGLSLSFRGNIPPQTGVFNNAEMAGSLLDTNEKHEFLSYSTEALPYALVPAPRVFVAGIGTGTEALRALQGGARSVRGVELSPALVEWISPKFALNPNVAISVGNARSTLMQDLSEYDIISIPILEGFASSAAGMSALAEDYLFTVESFRLMIQRLKERGLLAISSWLKMPERSSLKILTTLIEAAEAEGLPPDTNLRAIKSWGTMTAVLSKSPFSKAQLEAFEKFRDQMSFESVSISEELLSFRERADFYRNHPFRVIPATDNKPYFSHFFEWKSLPYLFKHFGVQGIAYFELGFVILLVTLAQVIPLSFALILFPVAAKLVRPSGKVLTYFGSLGLGFLFVEMGLIQNLVLFFGHPIYAVSVVITSLLIFSGLGSLASRALYQRLPEAQKLAAYTIATLLLAILYLNSPLITLVLIAPLAFFMGIPFPVGISRLENEVLPWALSINGFMSVISTGLATLVAVEWGISWVFIGAALLYGTAALSSNFAKPQQA